MGANQASSPACTANVPHTGPPGRVYATLPTGGCHVATGPVQHKASQESKPGTGCKCCYQLPRPGLSPSIYNCASNISVQALQRQLIVAPSNHDAASAHEGRKESLKPSSVPVAFKSWGNTHMRQCHKRRATMSHQTRIPRQLRLLPRANQPPRDRIPAPIAPRVLSIISGISKKAKEHHRQMGREAHEGQLQKAQLFTGLKGEEALTAY